MKPAPTDTPPARSTDTVTAYIGIGANLGDAQATVNWAFDALDALPHSRLAARSRLFRTTPVDADGDDYINAVAALHTTLTPDGLLAALQTLEQRQGRNRSYRNAPRTLDLDILLYGQQSLHTPTLTIPHPRLAQRAFALLPLLQIAPAIDIPGHGPAHLLTPAVAGQGICMIAP